jgi:hypothetical protein
VKRRCRMKNGVVFVTQAVYGRVLELFAAEMSAFGRASGRVVSEESRRTTDLCAQIQP